MTFEQELIKSAIDSGLLALIVLGAGVWLNWRLETYKVDIAQHSEFMKLRMAAMNSAWSDIYTWMHDCDFYFAKFQQEDPLKSLEPKNLTAYRTFVMSKTDELVGRLAAQRFYCGEIFIRDCLVFIGERCQHYVEYDPDGPWRKGPAPPWDTIESVEGKYLRRSKPS